MLLVEGRTEKLTFPLVFQALGHDADREGISIVECGGKPNMPLFVRVCQSAQVPYVVVHERRLPDTPLATAIRLCFLGRPASRIEAEGALSPDGVSALTATGLATLVDDDVVPRGRILPVEDLFLASDGFSRGVDDPPDYVATFTPTARRCAFLTPRRRVRSR